MNIILKVRGSITKISNLLKEFIQMRGATPLLWGNSQMLYLDKNDSFVTIWRVKLVAFGNWHPRLFSISFFLWYKYIFRRFWLLPIGLYLYFLTLYLHNLHSFVASVFLIDWKCVEMRKLFSTSFYFFCFRLTSLKWAKLVFSPSKI